jgi:polysaccharide deacetylase 2 family uncharacterized protein YibQ
LCLAPPAAATGEWAQACRTPPPATLAAPLLDKRLVLIIDDMGNRLDAGRAIVEMPGKLTIAVLPYTPHGHRLAERAHGVGKEVMLHAPMGNLAGIPLGPGGLTALQTEEEFRATLGAALDQLPHVKGINNHMGSHLTQREPQMQWVMEVLRERDLYFIDSRTSALTVAAGTAARHAVPHLSRKVFLDNERDPAAIDRAFRRLLREVESEGLAVGIGHPYPETIDYLRTALPRLACRGISLALVSEALAVADGDDSPPSEPDLDAPLGHVGLGLGYRVFPEVEDAGSQYRVRATDQDALHQVIEVSHPP